MNLTHWIDGPNLVIVADAEMQSHLQEMSGRSDFGSTSLLVDEFEALIANSEMEWIDPADTGDLTDAPMLGVLSPEQPGGDGEFGKVRVGRRADGQTLFAGIEKRWAYMAYQLRSPLADLAREGTAVFTSGE